MTTRRELTCRRIVELIDDYLDGKLPPRTRARIQEHLRTCGDCTRYADQLTQTVAATRSLGSHPPPAAFALPDLDVLFGELRRLNRS